jgi:hypothetical protein
MREGRGIKGGFCFAEAGEINNPGIGRTPGDVGCVHDGAHNIGIGLAIGIQRRGKPAPRYCAIHIEGANLYGALK